MATVTPVVDSLLPAWDVQSDESGQLHRVEQVHRQCPEPDCSQRCGTAGAAYTMVAKFNELLGRGMRILLILAKYWHYGHLMCLKTMF